MSPDYFNTLTEALKDPQYANQDEEDEIPVVVEKAFYIKCYDTLCKYKVVLLVFVGFLLIASGFIFAALNMEWDSDTIRVMYLCFFGGGVLVWLLAWWVNSLYTDKECYLKKYQIKKNIYYK